MNDLGPVMLQLEPMSRTSIGKATLAVSAGLGFVSLLFLGLGLFIMVFATSLGADLLAGLVFASVFLLCGLIGLCVAVVMPFQLSRTTATIHAHGLALGQSWFRRDRVLWSEVASVEPPRRDGLFIRCDFWLRSGRRIRVDRLLLRPRVDPYGGLVQHPDVQTVLNHLTAWQQRRGQAPAQWNGPAAPSDGCGPRW